jgi:hypothetical protein
MKHRLYFILVLAAGTAILAATGCGKKETAAKDAAKPDSVTVANTEDSVTIDLSGIDSVSPFALLQRRHVVDFKKTAMGVFVRGIDSIMAGPGTFWLYSVNDTMPEIAADRMLTRTGDKVVWHLRKAKR